MPPISNYPLYIYRVIMKWLSFLVFGLATLLLVLLVFPPMTLFLHPRECFLKYARMVVSFCFSGFVAMMHAIGIVTLDAGDREVWRHISSKILVANHPSLLDVVMLISLIPNADCIVNNSLRYNIVRSVITRLYILNSLNFEELTSACIESLNRGNVIIIFPEGTRTPRGGEIRLKRGAARISLLSGRNILPVHIGGTDKWGLGKRDPWAAFNHRDRYVYRIRMLDEIPPGRYAGLGLPRAVRHLTQEILEALTDADMEVAAGIPVNSQ
jgi:1-acyl-sn-glycerol-3-phosphate acyltransferase